MACPPSAALIRMSLRCTTDPLFLGAQLHLYAIAHGLSDDDLADRLELLDPHDLTRLRLCRACRTRSDIEAVAGEFGCSAGRLAAACGVE